MKTKLIFIAGIFLVILAYQVADAQTNNFFPKLTDSYLGQAPPGNEPLLFAPGIVSDGLHNRDLTMTPDGREIYFCSAAGNYNYMAIFCTKFI
ncbi:MAG: hypothetical protein MUC94_17540, partial [bacterium]|nr:hypothetical protein [bacterium]